MEPYSLVRDHGGRLHLTKEEASAAYAPVGKLPVGTVLEIKDVVYRISDPGRHDYYVIEIETSSGPAILEVPADDRNRPAWRYEAKG